jgi:hypothetical protein
VDHQTPFLVALALLIGAGAVVAVAGWTWFVRERRLARADLDRREEVRETDRDG